MAVARSRGLECFPFFCSPRGDWPIFSSGTRPAPAGAEACECVIGPTYLGRTHRSAAGASTASPVRWSGLLGVFYACGSAQLEAMMGSHA